MSDYSREELTDQEIIAFVRRWHPELAGLAAAKRDWDGAVRTGRRAKILWGYVAAALSVWSLWKFDVLALIAGYLVP